MREREDGVLVVKHQLVQMMVLRRQGGLKQPG
jgi:hypothetical protein